MTKGTVGRAGQKQPGGRAGRTLLGQGMFYVVATAAPFAVAMLLTPLVTRSLGADEYGRVALVVATMQIGQALIALGLPTSITRHVLLGNTGVEGASLQLALAAVLALALVALSTPVIGLSHSWSVYEPDTVVWLGAVVASALGAVFLSGQALNRGVGKPKRYAVAAVSYAFAPPAVGLIATLLSSKGAPAYLVGFLATQALVVLISVGQLLRRFPPVWRPSDLRSGLMVGIPTVPHQFGGVAVSSLPPIIVASLLGAAAAGELQLGILVGSMPAILVGALNNQWAYAVYASKSVVERKETIEATAGEVSIVAMLASWGMCLVAPELLLWIAPPTMDQDLMLRTVFLVAIAAPISVIYLANVHQVFASGRTIALGATTPFAALLALVMASRTLHLAQNNYYMMSSSIVLFMIIQVAVSYWLRKQTGMSRLRLSSTWTLAAATIVGIGMISLLSEHILWRWVLVSAVLLAMFRLVLVAKRR